jgi:predicted TIM-barrel fold metal-dependent hydrolase
MCPFNDAVIAANPKRLIWGSDWPHVGQQALPLDADLYELLGS